MERLTKRDTDGQAMMDCQKCEADWTGKHGKPMADCTALYCRNRLLDRLVEYEDTGLMPEEVSALVKDWSDLRTIIGECGGIDRLRELAEADKDGRLVVLPCKVGDVMYKLFREYTECTSYQVRKDNYCCEGCMVPCDSREVTVIRAIQPNSLPEVVRYIEEIGKTVFLTHEEAKKALEAME